MDDDAWPTVSDAARLARLSAVRSGAARIVIDTDAYNEIDDQFALVHALLSPERVRVEAIYAAPFHNARSTGPADGMEKSYAEVQEILCLLDLAEPPPVLRGATEWLTHASRPLHPAAVEDLIERARQSPQQPLGIVAIGAPTNVAAALRLAPDIMESIVVVWLGGNAQYWRSADEFNLRQDLVASQTMFDSGVTLVHVPCLNVADHLITTEAEIDRFVRPAGSIGAFLADRYAEHVGKGPGRSKVIWDLAALAWLMDPSWCESELTHSPRLSEALTWSRDARRHLIAQVVSLQRDEIFADLFAALAAHAAGHGACLSRSR